MDAGRVDVAAAKPRFDRLHSVGLELDMPLDEGIAEAVHILREAGIETIESCEGGPGHAFPEPTIRFAGNPGEGFRAYAIAVTFALPVSSLRRIWTVANGEISGLNIMTSLGMPATRKVA